MKFTPHQKTMIEVTIVIIWLLVAFLINSNWFYALTMIIFWAEVVRSRFVNNRGDKTNHPLARFIIFVIASGFVILMMILNSR